MKITFHGAVRTVTGSLHIVETAGGDIVLLDCGMFQGRRKDARARNETLPIDPSRVKAVVLSHAHIDHIGNLPTWVKNGLRCPVFATSATQDLCSLMLKDSAHIQESDVRHVNKHRRNHEQKVEPLYMLAHVEKTLPLIQPQKYDEWFDVVPNLRARFRDAGHILGSASITLEETHNGSTKRMAFTGDIGRPDSVILRDPQTFGKGMDVVLSESTYGDREHPPRTDLPGELEKVLKKTLGRGGKVIIPAFALGRTQTIMYALQELEREGKLPDVKVFVDSPMACRATDIIERHPECYDREAKGLFKRDGELFAIDHFTPVRAAAMSKALNDSKDPSVIISASGMCEAGRILHHLVHNINDPRNTILIVGFQAEHTLGRRLVEKWDTVRIFGRKHRVKADVQVLNGFSAHAGRSELADFLEKNRPQGPVFLVHGDERQSLAFEAHLENERGFPEVRIPDVGYEFQV